MFRSTVLCLGSINIPNKARLFKSSTLKYGIFLALFAANVIDYLMFSFYCLTTFTFMLYLYYFALLIFSSAIILFAFKFFKQKICTHKYIEILNANKKFLYWKCKKCGSISKA